MTPLYNPSYRKDKHSPLLSPVAPTLLLLIICPIYQVALQQHLMDLCDPQETSLSEHIQYVVCKYSHIPIFHPFRPQTFHFECIFDPTEGALHEHS